MILEGKSLQEYPVNTRVLQGSILSPTFFLLYMTVLIMLSVILLFVLMILISIASVIRQGVSQKIKTADVGNKKIFFWYNKCQNKFFCLAGHFCC